MKKYFITGLIIVLPLALTLAIIIFIINALTGPFLGFVSDVMEKYGILKSGFLFLNPAQVQKIVSQALILLMLFCVTLGIGMFARWFFFHAIIRFSEYIFHQIPVVRTIYKTAKDVINTIFSTDSRSFKQVVLVPFPNSETRSIALVTREKLNFKSDHPDDHKIVVFVPTTPNPTSGFLVMYPESQITYIDMKVEDAFKYVISCGVILPPVKKVTSEESTHILEEEESILKHEEEKR